VICGRLIRLSLLLFEFHDYIFVIFSNILQCACGCGQISRQLSSTHASATLTNCSLKEIIGQLQKRNYTNPKQSQQISFPSSPIPARTSTPSHPLPQNLFLYYSIHALKDRMRLAFSPKIGIPVK